MMALAYTALTTLLWLTMMMTTEAYSEGPPVNKYPQICENMSPIIGHHTEPQSLPPPFEIRILTTGGCYKAGQPMTGE